VHFESVTPMLVESWIDSPRVRADGVDLKGLCEDIEEARRILGDLARLVATVGVDEAASTTGIGVPCLGELVSVWASHGHPLEERVLLPTAIEVGDDSAYSGAL
jgi:hypothetical protein